MYGSDRREKLKLDIRGVSNAQEHFYQDLELIYVLRDSITVHIDGQETVLNEGDLYLINADKMHCLRGGEAALYARLMIAFQLVGDVLKSSDVMFRCDSAHEDGQRYQDLRKLFNQLLDRYLKVGGDTSDFRYISLCYQLMDLLTDKFLVLTAYNSGIDGADRFAGRIEQIDAYLRNNYRRAISLKDLSENLYLSTGYLSRFFKKVYGSNFVDYLYNIRLYHAMDELLYSDASITDIAFANGFPSVAVFDKVFKKRYGETPSAYRRREAAVKNETEGGDENLTAALTGVEEFLQDHAGDSVEQIKQARISVDVESSSELVRFWENAINACPVESLLQTETREHILRLREVLPFEYARVWNIFSRALLIDVTNDEGQYNFGRIDSALDFLIQNHIKPHVELGPKPKDVVRTTEVRGLSADDRPMYPAVAVWERVVEAFMRHVVARYGSDEVGTWRIELWKNEYTPVGVDDRKHYLDLFAATKRICKKHCPRIVVGGCGARADFEAEGLAEFVGLWAKRKDCIPDFFSASVYPYRLFEDGGVPRVERSTNNRAVLCCIQGFRNLLDEQGFAAVPLFISEWNGTVSARNSMNDTCFKAAYIVKNVLDAYGSTSGMAYFLGSDLESDFFDSDRPLYGGLGLMTKDGIFKPAGFAFSLLSKMYPRFVAKSENALVTTNGRSHYGVICHNQCELNNRYFRTDEDCIDPTDIDSYFDDLRPLSIHVELHGVVPGDYRIRVSRINKGAGSILDTWSTFDYEPTLSRADIHYLRKTCEPELSMKQRSSRGNVMEFDVELAANEVCFIDMRRI